MRTFFRIMIGIVLYGVIAALVETTGTPVEYRPIIGIGIIGVWYLFGWPKSPIRIKVEETILNPNNAQFVLDGVHDILEVFDRKIVITTKKTRSALLVRGSKGTKSIPFTSITAIQLRLANPVNGFIQFSILGGRESTGGIIDAISDENTIFFGYLRNDLAQAIVNYIETRLGMMVTPATDNVNESP